MRLFKKMLRSDKGQARILEAVIAAVIIFIAFAVALYFVTVSNVGVLEERSDLDRLGFNTLHRLVECGMVEATIEKGYQADVVKNVIQNSLPPSTCFNFTIFECIDQGYWVKLFRECTVDNISQGMFDKSMEVSSTSMIYTSRTGRIYQLVLVLAQERS